MTTVAEETSETTVAPVASSRASHDSPAVKQGQIVERAYIDASTRGPVLTFFTTAISWLLGATLLWMLVSIKAHSPGFLANFSWLTYGRVQPAFTNAFIYGWCSLAGMGVAIWLMARLCRVSIPAPGVLVYGAFFWNIGLTIGIISILMGNGRSLDTLEMPAVAHWIMFIGFVMIGLWGAVLYRHRRQAVAFISVWYLLGALFWFPWVFATTNVLLGRAELHGVMQSVVGAWYAQNLMGWWFTAVGLAAAYFFIPKVADRPIHSYQLASLGFWSFAFLSGLTGMVRLSGGPIPAWLVTISIAASIMLLVPVSTVTVNLVMTMKGAYNLVYHSPTIRFTFFGSIAFAIANLLGIITSFRSVDKLLHFTPFAQGQQQALLYCFFTMVMFGSIYYITPRLVGCEWLSSTLISLHFWGAAYGGGFIAVLLIIGGIAQGFTLNDPDGTFVQAVGVLYPFLVGRTFCLFLVAAGHIIFALHFLLMLLRIGQPGGEATLFAPLDEESHH